MVSNYDAFHAQLTRLLELVDQESLEDVHRDALATGIRVARTSGDDLVLPRLEARHLHPRAFELGESILAQLRSADEELSPEDVANLDALVRERLPETL